MSIVHHHLIFQAKVGDIFVVPSDEGVFRTMLFDLINAIHMRVLIPPQFAYSHQDAWTGMVGIVTSHISFHYWVKESYVQMDIYSCKVFDKEKAVHFMTDFWKAQDINILFIDREPGKEFQIT